MIEESLLNQLILGLGDKAWILILFLIFAKFMWPDIRDLLVKGLEAREKQQAEPHPLEAVVQSLTPRAMQPGMTWFVIDDTEARAGARELTTHVIEVAKETSSLVRDVRAKWAQEVEQSPVSPPVRPLREVRDSETVVETVPG